MKILIVDDSRTSRRINRTVVEQELKVQAEYLEAADGQEALVILEKDPVDLVLLDLTMPGMSGYEVLAEMQRRHLPAKVLVLSADVQPQAREKILALGAVDFVAKPIRGEVLREVLLTQGFIHV